MKIHLAGNNPYPGIILIRLYESWIGERLGKFKQIINQNSVAFAS